MKGTCGFFGCMNDIIFPCMSGAVAITLFSNDDCFHGSEMKCDDDDDLSLIIMSSNDVQWVEARRGQKTQP